MLKRKQIQSTERLARPADTYSLNCGYYTKTATSIQDLVELCLADGMDPNYEILKNGKSTGENLFDYIQP